MRILLSMVLLAASATLHAATLESMTIEEMAQQATAVARGRVGEARTDRFGALVYTLYRFEVLDQWSGSPIAGLEVGMPGGTFEGVTYRFAGTPELGAGEEYVLFLWTGPSGRTQVVGLSQGVFRVIGQGGAAIAARTEATHTVFVGDEDAAKKQGVEMPLERLAARVRAALAEREDR